MLLKSEARSEAKKRCRDVGKAYLNASADKAARRFLSLPEFEAARTVFLYVGVFPEPDTAPVIEAALAAGKAVALPRVSGKGVMEARLIGSLSELSPGAWGIPEPPESAPVISPGDIDLVLVPGAAFSEDLCRLGRGGGYYDRYLALTPALRVAIARERLLTPVPAEEHDLKMDMLVTEDRVIV